MGLTLRAAPLHRKEVALDVAGFEAMYRANVGAIYRFCLTQLREPMLAEDAAADVFTAALRAWRRLDDYADVRQWLFRVARNVIADHYRAVRRRQRLNAILGRARVPEPDPEALVGVRDDVRRMGEVIVTLSRRDQVLIGLRASSGLSHGEIGKVMGMSEEAARVAIHRALKKIRGVMEIDE